MAEKIKKFVCLHGHFYQPPRENPWLEDIEIQDSASPYRNWNERITAECYAPNAASRILDDKGNITDIVNNYSKISFNFGPTLLTWLQQFAPDVYAAILEADKISTKNFSGHGSALAQAYNHMIMPLANERDRRTQVLWGIADFESRFGRKPEGMWLPETAVDLATLELLAEYKIKFTILAPRQAKSIRKIGDKNWNSIRDGEIDPQKPYQCNLPSGASIAIFFYDGPVSHDIAFGGLLHNGENFANRLFSAFPKDVKEPRLVHIATDGETFGHHHRYGNMALSYCLRVLEGHRDTQYTVYGEYLSQNPPTQEVEIHENSSWSCAHGVERWRNNCGCRVGAHNWHQRWRSPLRETLDWLRDTVAPLYENRMADICSDPWEARDQYIYVILDRSPISVERFLSSHFKAVLSKEEKVKILKLLEIQRHAMYMYTSCGWFFDDISGIETVQILQYASRVIQLAKEVLNIDLENEFIRRLEGAPSNLPDVKDGSGVYEIYVKPARIDLRNVGIHFAISSAFEKFPETAHIYCYTIQTLLSHEYEVGKQRLLVGQTQIRSLITWDEAVVDFAVLYFGDYNLNGGVRYFDSEDSFREMNKQLQSHFLRNDIPEVIGLMHKYFGQNNYSLWDLFKNEQGKVLNQIFDSTMDVISANFREIYEHYAPLMRIRPDLKIPLPKALAMTVEFTLNRDMIAVLEADVLDLERMEAIAQDMRRWTFTRDKETVAFVAGKRIEKLMYQFYANSNDIDLARTIATALRILRSLSLNLDLLKAQNYFFSLSRSIYPSMKEKASAGNEKAGQWVAAFENLGRYLKVAI